MCVLFWTQSVSIVQKQNTRNIYHKRVKDGVQLTYLKADAKNIPQ